MGSLSFGAKMAIIGAVFLCPIALLIAFLYAKINADLSFYVQEREGVQYTIALRPLLADLAAARLASDPAARAAARRNVDADFATVGRYDAGAGRDLLLSDELAVLHRRWNVAPGSAAVLDADIDLLDSVSDNAKITLDPILDGYYVGDTMVHKIPRLIESIVQSSVVGSHALRLHRLPTNDRIKLTFLSGKVDMARDGIDHNLPIATGKSPYLRSRLEPPQIGERNASSNFAIWFKAHLLEPSAPGGDRAELEARRTAALAAAFTLYDASIAAFDTVLRHRIQALVREESTIFSIVGVAIAVAAGLMLVTTRSMSRMLTDKVALEREIVEREQVEQQLAYAAFHDELTGLRNRAYLMDRLDEIFARPAHAAPAWAILFLDLDRFKVINDSLGHAAGDSVLIESARRLEGCVRSGDALVRLGGDEFVILLDDIESVGAACGIAQRVLQAFNVAFSVAGREVFAGASIGIATSESGDNRPGDVMRNADIALYRAKELGKQRFELYTPDLLVNAVTRLEVDTDLARALERGEFVLHYQPIVTLSDGRLRGFEALVRWQHPRRGLVMPDEFIEIAEENGAIVALGDWILRESCRQLAAWRAAGASTELTVNVNVSATQLRTPGFASIVESALGASGLPSDAVRVEITESVLMSDPVQANATLTELRRLGVQIHLDDFGTGYSSLAYLRDFPIDGLKIDRSFVSLEDDATAAKLASVEIVRMIIALARSLGLAVTAEGIETAEQCAELRALACTSGQGYFFSRAVDPAEAEALMTRWDTDGHGAHCGPAISAAIA